MVIEEKLDGKSLYEKCNGYIFFGEYLKYTHSIHYTQLPRFIVIFDVFKIDGSVWLDRQEKEIICKKYGRALCPLLFQGDNPKKDFLVSMLDQKSQYGESKIEGIVVKNYQKNLFGKLINLEFESEITEHWTKIDRKMNWIVSQYKK